MQRLLYYPNEFLKIKCQDIDINNPELPQIIEKMRDIIYDRDGLGLSASQIGLDWNLFVMLRGKDEVQEFINPRIEKLEGNTRKTREGCLSIPGIQANLNCRHEKCTISALSLNDSERKIYPLMGLEATIVQHEIDHANGITIMDRMGQAQRMLKRKKYMKALRKFKKQIGTYLPGTI